ncbi:MAG TPA: hypothetical protein VGP24_04585 [Glaciihabitans sp.]|jgi:hypothetical protein|nr:hypothetical protein [Glaciihabitans sp.]
MNNTRFWRIGLIVLGLGLLGIGGIVLLNDVGAGSYLGIGVWFLGALIIHDGIIGAAVLVASLLLRRAQKRIPLAVLLIIQGAVVVAAIVSMVVVPQIIKQGIGTLSSSILPLPYGVNLLLFYVGLAIVTAVTVLLYLRVAARRQKLRSPIVQA